MPRSSTRKNSSQTGLRYWMMRVLEECDRVSANFSADPVHDLRVALRRCRSMADGLRALDPDPEWKAMKKAGRTLFRSLGDLRDVQVMMEWVEKLHPVEARMAAVRSNGDNPADSLSPVGDSERTQEAALSSDVAADHLSRDLIAHALLNILAHRESQHKQEAKIALEEFDHKQWRHWSESLPRGAARFRLGSSLFKHLALERWTEARKLHDRALRSRSQAALHALRIGIKRFRYMVENFLPAEHEAWSHDLKEIQDLLGEIHDLDVLWNTAVSSGIFADEEAKRRWQTKIAEERRKRIDGYRKKMVGAYSLWNVWRAALPQGSQIERIATRRMKLWAKALDPDFAHSERVAKLAVELYDGLASEGLFNSHNGASERFSLWVAALLHDVGKARKRKGHHKASRRLIAGHGVPLGWKPEQMRRAAVIARFHCGALPSKGKKALRDLLPDEQKRMIRLAAIMRLANAFDVEHNGRVRSLRVEANGAGNGNHSRSGYVVVRAEGFSPRTSTARAVAAERYLLETILHRPVMVTAASRHAASSPQ